MTVDCGAATSISCDLEVALLRRLPRRPTSAAPVGSRGSGLEPETSSSQSDEERPMDDWLSDLGEAAERRPATEAELPDPGSGDGGVQSSVTRYDCDSGDPGECVRADARLGLRLKRRPRLVSQWRWSDGQSRQQDVNVFCFFGSNVSDVSQTITGHCSSTVSVSALLVQVSFCDVFIM